MKKAQGTLVIGNGQLIDGTGAAPIANAVVHLVDGIIRHMWLNADSLEDRACPGLAH